jgi:hypothetical protein
MFDVLERQERTAHFPAPTDYPACSRFYAGIIDRYDSAMMKADTAAAVDIKGNYILDSHTHNSASSLQKCRLHWHAIASAMPV